MVIFGTINSQKIWNSRAFKSLSHKWACELWATFGTSNNRKTWNLGTFSWCVSLQVFKYFCDYKLSENSKFVSALCLSFVAHEKLLEPPWETLRTHTWDPLNRCDRPLKLATGDCWDRCEKTFKPLQETPWTPLRDR